MIFGPLFFCFWGTLVDVKKVIDAHSCLKAHIQHKNIIIWLVVPHYLMWTIWLDWNTWTYLHVVLWFFWGLFTFMIVTLYEALHFNATLLYQTHFILRKKLCLIIHFIGLAMFLDYFFCLDPESVCYCSLYQMSSPLPLKNKGWALKSWV